MPAVPKQQKPKAVEKKGKYTPVDSRRSCSICRALHDGGVNELCTRAAPHAIANYCHAAKIPYPAELTKGSRSDSKAGPSQPPPTVATPKAPVKVAKKDNKGGKHSSNNPQTPQRQPTQQQGPPTQQTPVPSTSQGEQATAQGNTQQAQQQGWGSPVLTPTHTFAEFCTEVTAAIQPSIAKIIQETLSQSQLQLPPRQTQAPPHTPAHMPPPETTTARRANPTSVRYV